MNLKSIRKLLIGTIVAAAFSCNLNAEQTVRTTSPKGGSKFAPGVVTFSTPVKDDSGATFNIAYDLTPFSDLPGATIKTRFNSAHWGVADVDHISNDALDVQFSDAILFNNLRIQKFKANGSGLTQANFSDLSFSFVTFPDSANQQIDNIRVTINDTNKTGTITGGIANSGPQFKGHEPDKDGIDLLALGEDQTIKDFKLTSTGGSWSIISIDVRYRDIPEPSLSIMICGLSAWICVGLRRRHRSSTTL